MSPHHDDTDEKLQGIDGRLRSIERALKSSAEEQLFFGIAFSLLVLFITLPMNDVISFLRNILPLSYDLAAKSAIGIRGVGIVFALSASFLRYYGSMCGEQTCKRTRYFSILSLLMGFEFFILIVGQNTFYGIAVRTPLASISFGTLLMTIIFAIIFLFEKRMLDFYTSRRLIIKSEAVPVVSLFFLFLTAAMFVGLIAGVLSFFVIPTFADSIQTISFFAFFLMLWGIYIKRLGWKHTQNRGRRVRPFQSKLSRWL